MKDEIVNRWLRKADSDFKAVKQLLTFEDALIDVISFHCQQAVEKYLKAYLTWGDIRAKKTHDLETLLNMCIENDKEFEQLEKEKIARLSLYAVTVRYPEEFLKLTTKEVNELFLLVQKTKEFIMKKITEK